MRRAAPGAELGAMLDEGGRVHPERAELRGELGDEAILPLAGASGLVPIAAGGIFQR